jgi:hypothetical protein
MARARVVAPPPKDYIPEPLVAPPPPPEIVEEQEWIEGNLEEAVVEEQITEELIYLRQDLDRQMTIANERVNENEMLREEIKKLIGDKEAAEKAREETIVAMRNKATEQRGNQLNIVKQRTPSVWSRLKAFFRRRRIELATIPTVNYEVAIIQRAKVAVPKMLDDIEKMHEQLTIIEELIAQYTEREKIKDR